MKKKFFLGLLMVVLVFGLVPKSVVHGAAVHQSKQEAQYHDQTMHLFKVTDGFERVEWDDDLFVERYSHRFKLLSSTKVDVKTLLPSGCSKKKMVFGSVYEGSQYNFVCTGRNNTTQNKDLITLRVAKFDKGWHYLGACEMNDQCGVEIYEAFDFASCRMNELGDTLYLSTGRTGFGISDIHHQGKLNVLINIPDMRYIGSASDFYHSFDQYLTVCNGKMYQMELSEGDRCVYVEKLDPNEYTGVSSDTAWTSNVAAGSDPHRIKEIFKFWTKERDHGMWSYGLGGSTGGLASSDAHNRLLCVGYSGNQDKMQQAKDIPDQLVGNIWIRSIDAEIARDTGQVDPESWDDEDIYEDVSDIRAGSLTGYADGGKRSARNPCLVKINDDRFLVLWQYDEEKIAYVYVDAYGNKTSKTYKMTGSLTGSEPISDDNGNIVWYTPVGWPIFYKIDANGKATVKALGSAVKGTYITIGTNIYEVTKSGQKKAEVSLANIDASKKSIHVPAKISYNSFTYQVTGIRPLSSKKLKKLTLGKNIKKIDDFAFYDCRKLKQVTIQSKKLVRIGHNAFYYGNRKLTVKVPKAKKKAYQKLLKKAYFDGRIK